MNRKQMKVKKQEFLQLQDLKAKIIEFTGQILY